MASMGLEPDGSEEEMLTLASDLADRVAQLEDAIAAEGLTTVSKSGVVHLHPGVAESRQTRAALAKALAGVQTSEGVKDPVKVKAADARWRSHNLAKKSIGG